MRLFRSPVKYVVPAKGTVPERQRQSIMELKAWDESTDHKGVGDLIVPRYATTKRAARRTVEQSNMDVGDTSVTIVVQRTAIMNGTYARELLSALHEAGIKYVRVELISHTMFGDADKFKATVLEAANNFPQIMIEP